MHGRIKVKTTAQQAEERRKEQEKKVARLKQGINVIFEKISNNIYDEEGMMISGKILTVNSDYYSMWNYRREYFSQLKTDEKVDRDEQLKYELEFARDRLKENPKSYSCWHHRCWINGSQMTNPDWSNELALCNLFLQSDDRNFHCWDYRRYVIPHCDVTREQELDVTRDLISKNFSNYSSWHYRSKLLSEETDRNVENTICGMRDDLLYRELELAQAAYFTDPNDQSAWFYHRWLIGRKQRPRQLLSVHAERSGVTCVISQRVEPSKLWVKIDSELVAAPEWAVTTTSSNKFANLYRCEFEHPLVGAHEFEVGVGDDLSMKVCLEEGAEDAVVNDFRQIYYDQVSAEKITVLRTEIESLEQLDEVEPDNKWVLLTLVRLMLKVDPRQFNGDRVGHLIEQLSKIDPKRVNYYNDLVSRYKMETAIYGLDEGRSGGTCQKFELVNAGLTALYGMEFFTQITYIDLSGNNLTEINEKISLCKRLQTFKANRNKIQDVRGLCKLKQLKVVELNGNLISSFGHILQILSSSPGLEKIELRDNDKKLLSAAPSVDGDAFTRVVVLE